MDPLPETPAAQRELLQKLFVPEEGGKLGVSDLTAIYHRLISHSLGQASVELDPTLEQKLRGQFDRAVGFWESCGLFSKQRSDSGYEKPSFETYREHFARSQRFMRPSEDPKELDAGYQLMTFVPWDVPVISDDPERISLFSLLDKVLREEFFRKGPDKPGKSFVVKTRKGERTVVTDVYDATGATPFIVFDETSFLQDRLVHYPRVDGDELTFYGSQSKVLHSGTPLEQQHGGFMLIQRPTIILPKDIGKETMAAQDWRDEIEKLGDPAIELQTLNAGIAFLIQYILEHHCLPDATLNGQHQVGWQIAATPESAIIRATQSDLPLRNLPVVTPAMSFNPSLGRISIYPTINTQMLGHIGVRTALRIHGDIPE